MKIEFYHIDAFEVPNFEPIWRALREVGVEANLVGVPCERNVAGKWFDFDRFKQYCDERSLEFTTEMDPNANLAVTTQNADILRQYHCPKTRIMYGPIMYPQAWGLQRHSIQPFDGVLTHSQFYTDFYSQWLRPDQLPVCGYPRYDDFFAGKLKRDAIRARWNIQSNKPVVIFSPTWGDNTGFEKFFPALLNLAHKYTIVLRPHHCTLRMEPQRMAMLQASGLLILENAFDLAEIFAAADVIIGDTRSGALFESCLCQVPTVGMVVNPAELSGWLQQNQVGRFVSLCSDPTQLEAAIDTALTSQSQAQERQRFAAERVAFRDGSAGKEAAAALIALAS